MQTMEIFNSEHAKEKKLYWKLETVDLNVLKTTASNHAQQNLL
jgi:hypothetical protein